MRGQTNGKVKGDLGSFVGDVGEEAGLLMRLHLVCEGCCRYRRGKEGQYGGP